MNGSSRRADAPPAAPVPLDRRVVLVLCALVLNTLMSMLDQSIVATAGPTVVGELGGLDSYAWVFTAYMLAFSVTMPLYGKLGDLFGRKPVHLVAITLFLVGSVACGLAQDMNQLVAFRVVQGIGGGGLVVLGMGTLGDLLEPRRRARYQGYFAAVFMLANLGGPVLGGVLTDQVGWRWVFFVNVPVGLATFTLLAVFLHRGRPDGRPRIDYAGALTLSGAIIGALLVAAWGGTRYGWTSGPIVALVAGTLVLFVGWLLVERTAADPVLPLRLFRDPTFAISATVAFASSFAFFGCINFIPLFLQLASGVSPTRTGLLYLPAMLCVAGASLLAGGVIGRTGRYKWFPVVSMGVAAVGMALLSTVDAGTDALVSAGYLAVVGFGVGLSQQVMTLVAQNTAPQRDLGVATSTVGLFRNVGVPFGTAVFGAILNARLAAELPRRLPDGSGVDPHRLTQESVTALPAAVQAGLAEAYGSALAAVFRWAVPVLLLGFVAALLLRDIPLQRRHSGLPPGGPGNRPGAGPDGVEQHPRTGATRAGA